MEVKGYKDKREQYIREFEEVNDKDGRNRNRIPQTVCTYGGSNPNNTPAEGDWEPADDRDAVGRCSFREEDRRSIGQWI